MHITSQRFRVCPLWKIKKKGLKMRKEIKVLLDDLISSGVDGWVKVDLGEAEVTDMIE